MKRLIKTGVVALLALGVLLGNTAVLQAGVTVLLDDCGHCKCGGKSTCCIKKADAASSEQAPATPAPTFRLNQPMLIATAWLQESLDGPGSSPTFAVSNRSFGGPSKVPVFLRHRSILI